MSYYTTAHHQHLWEDVGVPQPSAYQPDIISLAQKCKLCGAVRFVTRRAKEEV